MGGADTHFILQIKKRTIFIAMLVIAIVTPVLATYIGPIRDYTTQDCVDNCVEKTCSYQGTFATGGGCSLTVNNVAQNDSCPGVGTGQWQAYCGGRTPTNVVVSSSCSKTEETCTTINNTYPSATVSGTVICGTNGINGWCRDSASVSITSNEPLGGETIFQIEGYMDGSDYFTCASGNCSATVPNGTHSFEYWALSTFNDSSLKGSQSAKLDTDVPTLTPGSVIGTFGSNGWYNTDVTLSATADDATSGLATLYIYVDSTPFASPKTLSEGTYSTYMQATDNAGAQTSTITVTLNIDTTQPTISSSLSGLPTASGWYTSTPTLTITTSDATSGIDTVFSNLNNAGDVTYSVPFTLPDGDFTSIITTATDLAGWTNIDNTLTAKVDTTIPTLTFNALPSSVNANVTISGTAIDTTSGIDKLEVQLPGGSWQTVTPAGDGSWSINWNSLGNANGAYTINARASDVAGWFVTASQIANVDNSKPSISIPSAWNIWETVTPIVTAGTGGNPTINVIVHDPQNRWPDYSQTLGKAPVSFTWGRLFGDGTVAPIGNYQVTFTASDPNGQKSTATGTLMIPMPDPTATPTTQPTSQSTTTDPIATNTESAAAIIPTTSENAPDDKIDEVDVDSNKPIVKDSGENVEEDNTTTSNSVEESSSVLSNTVLALAGAGALYALARQRKKEEAAARKATLAIENLITIPKSVSFRIPNLIPVIVQEGWREIRKRVPIFIEQIRNVISTVKEKVPVFVDRIVNIPRTIMKAVPRYIERIKKVVERVVQSKLVARTRQVLKTVWQTIEEKVPVVKKVFNWLTNTFKTVTAWVSQKVYKPVTKWVTEKYQEVKTWVEEKVSYIKETVQSGVKWVREKIWEPVKQTVQNGWKWVEKKVTTPIKETVQRGWKWVTEKVANNTTQYHPQGSKLQSIAIPVGIRERLQAAANDGRLLQEVKSILNSPSIRKRMAVLGLTVVAVMTMVTNCGGPRGEGSGASATATNNALVAFYVETMMAETTQTAIMNETPTVTPTATPTITQTPSYCLKGICVLPTFITSGGVNVWGGPNGNFLKSLGCGYRFTIIGELVKEGNYLWAKVEILPNTHDLLQSSFYVAVYNLKDIAPMYDDSDPVCSPVAGNGEGGGNSSSGAILNNVAMLDGAGWDKEDNHFAIDIYSGDSAIISPWNGTVVDIDLCEDCPGEDGNTKDERYEENNWGYANMTIVEYTYAELQESGAIAELEANDIVINEGQSLYLMNAHLDPNGVFLTEGDKIDQGDNFATMGNSGDSGGAHLHLEGAVSASGIENVKNKSGNDFWQDFIVQSSYSEQGNRVNLEPIFGP